MNSKKENMRKKHLVTRSIFFYKKQPVSLILQGIQAYFNTIIDLNKYNNSPTIVPQSSEFKGIEAILSKHSRTIVPPLSLEASLKRTDPYRTPIKSILIISSKPHFSLKQITFT